MKVKSRAFSIHTKTGDILKTIDANEAVILSFLPTKWKWITRNKNGDLFIFEKKPIRNRHLGDFWYTHSPGHNEGIIFPYSRMFKSVKWSDEGPTNIDKLLKENMSSQIVGG